MKIKYLLILFLSVCFSCKPKRQPDEKFDKAKWAVNVDDEYLYRNLMINDLMSHHELHGLKKDKIIEMLGEPNRIDSSYLFYTVFWDHIGPLTVHTKTLVIKFGNDRTVEWRKIHE